LIFPVKLINYEGRKACADVYYSMIRCRWYDSL